MIRDWTDSETIDNLGDEAEVFFLRLIMKADDHGCFYADARLLKSNLYPLRDLSIKYITSVKQSLVDAGLIREYSVDGKQYVQIIKFGQRLRTMKSKFPLPPDYTPQTNVSKSRTNVSKSRTNDGLKRELEEELELELEPEEEVEGTLVRDFNWYMSQFTEAFLVEIKYTHKGKDIELALKESFIHISADPARLAKMDSSDCRRLLNTWLSNTKLKKDDRNNQKNDLKSNLVRLAKGAE